VSQIKQRLEAIRIPPTMVNNSLLFSMQSQLKQNVPTSTTKT